MTEFVIHWANGDVTFIIFPLFVVGVAWVFAAGLAVGFMLSTKGPKRGSS